MGEPAGKAVQNTVEPPVSTARLQSEYSCVPKPERYLVWTTILVAVAWLAREIGAVVIKNLSARLGAVGYVPQVSGFFHTVVLDDGRQIEAMYQPELRRDDLLSATLSCRGEIFNDTETPVLLRDCRVTFVHPHLPPLEFHNPSVLINGERVLVVHVPARASVPIAVETPIPFEMLPDYESRIPLLTARTSSGRTFRFWLATISFLIRNRSVLGPGKKPVFLLSSGVGRHPVGSAGR